MNHRLTDEMCEELSGEPLSELAEHRAEWIRQDMRAAADWQLDQVKEKVKTKLSEWRRWSPDLYEEPCDHIENFFHYVMQELRPQEDNS